MWHQYQGFNCFQYKNFNLETLEITSSFLKKNPLGDSHVRHNPVLIPKTAPPKKGYSVVFILAGFTGNGPKYFSLKTYEDNLPSSIDGLVSKRKAPRSVYVFVDATTFWGGSQFLDSVGQGLYESYIIKELVPALKSAYPVSDDPHRWCVSGGSSGGYGALHLVSRYPELFSYAAAVAPDSFFEQSLLPDIYKAIPSLQRWGSVKKVAKEIEQGRFKLNSSGHSIVNAIGMGLSYSGLPKGEVSFPVDFSTGELDERKWKVWKSYDPIEFLKKRKKKLKKVKKIWLDVGTDDQFNLQFGTRRIYHILKDQKIPVQYSEFQGNHFDIGGRRPLIWEWLKKNSF